MTLVEGQLQLYQSCNSLKSRTLIFYLHILAYIYFWNDASIEDQRLLFEDKQRFPDSSFSASASSEGHSASDARISSGSSWCAPVSNDKHYLQVDLRRLYQLYSVVTYGDSTSSKWVATYNVNYTVDLMNWKTVNWVRSDDISKIYIKSYTSLIIVSDIPLFSIDLLLFSFV